MLLKKFNSLALCFGLLGSLACQGVSGTEKVSHIKDDNIYLESKKVKRKESCEKANALLGTVKNKLEQTKDFIFENPGAVVGTAALGLLTPAAVYAGYKLGQHYFNKKCETPTTDVKLENPVKDKMDIEIPAEPTKSEENIENGENGRVSNHTLPGDSNNNTATSPEEKNSVDPSDGSIKNEKSSEDNAENLDPTANDGEVLNSSGNVNVLDEDKNLNKKSVFLGVYSEPIIYLSLKLTPQSWGLQKAWYDFLHYKNGRFAEPLKLLLAMILWVGFLLDVCGFLGCTYSYIYHWIHGDLCKNAHRKVAKTFLSFLSPTVSRLIGIFCDSLCTKGNARGECVAVEANWKDRLVGAILGCGAFNCSVVLRNPQNKK